MEINLLIWPNIEYVQNSNTNTFLFVTFISLLPWVENFSVLIKETC